MWHYTSDFVDSVPNFVKPLLAVTPRKKKFVFANGFQKPENLAMQGFTTFGPFLINCGRNHEISFADVQIFPTQTENNAKTNGGGCDKGYHRSPPVGSKLGIKVGRKEKAFWRHYDGIVEGIGNAVADFAREFAKGLRRSNPRSDWYHVHGIAMSWTGRPHLEKDGIELATVFAFGFEGLTELLETENEASVQGWRNLVDRRIANDFDVTANGDEVIFDGTFGENTIPIRRRVNASNKFGELEHELYDKKR